MRRAALVLVALALPVTSAGAQAPPRIYSSLPLQGSNAPQSRDAVDAMRLALEERGSPVELVSLDDSTEAAGGWAPEKASANARRAASDERAMAYLGEFNSGASAVSMPILNEAGILQVSPVNGYVGLTRSEGAEPGEPEKYFPSGSRTYGRVSPADHFQAQAIAALVKGRRLFVVDDAEVYGVGIASMTARRARARGVKVVGRMRIDPRARRYPGVARRVRAARPTTIVFGGIAENHAAAVWRALHRGAPRARLLGAEGLTDASFARGIPRGARRLTRVVATRIPHEGLLPAGQAFEGRFQARYGRAPREYAIYGYEAMQVALDSLAAGGSDRAAIVRSFFSIRDRDSVLGRYSIDPNGDPTAGRIGVYGVSRSGAFSFERAITLP